MQIVPRSVEDHKAPARKESPLAERGQKGKAELARESKKRNRLTRSAASQKRTPADARKVMTGIIFVLKTGVPWKSLPATSDLPFGAYLSPQTSRMG